MTPRLLSAGVKLCQKKCQDNLDSVKKIDSAGAGILKQNPPGHRTGGFCLLGTKIAIHLVMNKHYNKNFFKKEE